MDFSEKLSAKISSRDFEEMDAVRWSLPDAEGGGGDWAELELEPEPRTVRLDGGLFPDARWTRFWSGACIEGGQTV